MIKAVIFDCFGVLASDGCLPFREKHFAGNAELLELAIASNKRVDAGLHSYEDFLEEIAKLSGVSFGETKRLIETNPPNEALFDFIRNELKPEYKIGMLSNAGANWLDEIFEPSQVALFDGVVLSYQIGAIKPEPVTYETIASKLGVLPEECVFVDDQPRYADGAERIGMKSIQFTNTDAAIANIREVLRA